MKLISKCLGTHLTWQVDRHALEKEFSGHACHHSLRPRVDNDGEGLELKKSGRRLCVHRLGGTLRADRDVALSRTDVGMDCF